MNWIQEWQQQAEAEIARKEAKAKARDAQNRKPLANTLEGTISESCRTTGNRQQWRKHKSMSMACHPSQVKEFQAHADAAGLTGVRYAPTGEPHISSPGQLKGLCKIRDMVNHDGLS
jgi:hypothetical protein